MLDFSSIYDLNYYQGQGADPKVDYLYELHHPETTIRQYEWRGILAIVTALLSKISCRPQDASWLDFGCGNGGLVRYAQRRGCLHVRGYETGAIAGLAKGFGIPLISEEQLFNMQGCFDLVTAIEVIEHVPRPIDVLRQIRRLLRPTGVLFLTTGNARPFRDCLLDWRYVVPEIHIGFYEPETLAFALTRTGFTPIETHRLKGWTDILRFKILKNLGVRRRGVLESCLPWSILTRAADLRFQVSHHPAGIALRQE
jgi:SAM-dependent methyltransferase